MCWKVDLTGNVINGTFGGTVTGRLSGLVTSYLWKKSIWLVILLEEKERPLILISFHKPPKIVARNAIRPFWKNTLFLCYSWLIHCENWALKCNWRVDTRNGWLALFLFFSTLFVHQCLSLPLFLSLSLSLSPFSLSFFLQLSLSISVSLSLNFCLSFFSPCLSFCLFSLCFSVPTRLFCAP